MPPNLARTLLLSLFAASAVFHSTFSFATEPSPTPTPAATKSEEPLILQVYQVPAGTFDQPAGVDGKPPQKISLKNYFENFGIQFPPGSEIALDRTGKFLIVRQTQEQLDLMDVYCGSTDSDDGPCQVEIEISAFQCSSTTLSKLQSSKELTTDLITNLGKLLVPLDRVNCISKSGNIVVSDILHDSSGNSAPTPHSSEVKATAPASPADLIENAPFAPGEYGTKVKVMLTIGADGETMDFQLAYRLRLRNSNTDKVPLLDIKAQTNFSVKDGLPLIIKTATLPSRSKKNSEAETQNLVVILHANVIGATGRIWRQDARKVQR